MAESVNEVLIKIKADASPLKSFNSEIRKAKEEVAKASLEFGKGSAEYVKASQKLKVLQTDFTSLKNTVKDAGNAIKLSKYQLLEFGENLTVVTAGVKAALSGMTSMVGGFIDEANKLQAANLGLESIANFKGISPQSAQTALQNLDLVKNGLLTVGDAALALKNLLASGFSLEESINLIKGFGDSAAFGRQSSLEFGQAITSATEGLKNQNSILVDNAGVTKNLSVILQEAGFSAKDLQNVQSDSAVRTALYNGLLKETAAFTGDASKLTETFAGQQAKLNAQITTLKQEFGVFLQNALLPYIQKITESDKATRTFTGGVFAAGGAIGELLPALAAAKYAFGGVSLAAFGTATAIGAIVAATGLAIKKLDELENKQRNQRTDKSMGGHFNAWGGWEFSEEYKQQQNPDLTVNIPKSDPKDKVTQQNQADIEADKTKTKTGGAVNKVKSEGVKLTNDLIDAQKKYNDLLAKEVTFTEDQKNQRVYLDYKKQLLEIEKEIARLQSISVIYSTDGVKVAERFLGHFSKEDIKQAEYNAESQSLLNKANSKEDTSSTYEDVSNTYGAINNMMSVLNLGTETFVSKLLGGFNTVLTIMEAIKAVNSILSFIPGFASGGSFSGGSPIMVGERGAELLFPTKPGYVMNNQDSQRYLNSSVNNSQPAINLYVGANLSPKYFTAQLEKANSRKNYIRV